MADRSLRPRRADDLGLRRALSDRLLPFLVAAMTFLAALAVAGAVAAAALARNWQDGAAASLTIQVPDPDAASGSGTRADTVLAMLRTTPALASARRLSDQELSSLLRPWLGADPAALALKLPAMFEASVTPGSDLDALAARLGQAVPGTLVERDGDWLARVRARIAGLRACAALAVLLVAGTAAAMVAVATRAGLAARREAIEIVHGLGATDGLIAGQFAGRIAALALAGSLIGVVLAIPVLLGLAILAAPFTGTVAPPHQVPADTLRSLPAALWTAFPVFPISAGAIAWATAQATVRLWLARLP